MQVGNCIALWGATELTYDVKYPLEAIPGGTQLTIGHLKLKAGDHVAALDDTRAFISRTASRST